MTAAASLSRALLDNVFPRRKLLAQLRTRWGRPGDRDGFLASRYFDLVRGQDPGAWLNDKTWGDLEFPDIFARMDCAVTSIGSQILYAQLRKRIDEPAKLGERYALYAQLAANARLRQALQLPLSRLEGTSCAELADILFAERTEKRPRRALIWSWSLLSIVMPVLVGFGLSGWFWIAVLAVNVFVIYRGAWRQGREAEAMGHCATLLGTADKLVAMRTRHPGVPQLARLHDERGNRRVFRRELRLFFGHAFLKTTLPPPISAIFPLLNFAFLTELAIHAGAVEKFFAARGKLHETFELVGEIDAAIAVASFLQMYRQHCSPTFTHQRTMEITDGCHPLLPDGVCNSIHLRDQSILVTGSNMAGKTTFIKMLACNAILGQTVGFCLAHSATLPHASVLASIHGAHSVASGKSHFFAEIEAIDGFIRNAAPGGIRIIALDEPFSGTNTVERIAIARAILEALGDNAIVLATTHDVELQALLGSAYRLCHFQEDPDVEDYFDYTLRQGPATERNAIRLLQRMAFPETITDNAMRYAGADSATAIADNPAGSARPAGSGA